MKVLKISVYLIAVLFVAWFLMSWCDIVADNCFANPVHHSWNLFLLTRGAA